jgi:hypothetical protein
MLAKARGLVMRQLCGWVLLLTGVWLSGTTWAADDNDAVQEGLAELNEFIGQFKGTAGPDKTSKPETWSENMAWSYKFAKGKPPALAITVEKGKYFEKGDLRYLPDSKKYELSLVMVDKKATNPVVLTGELKKGYLTLEGTDAKTGDAHRLVMSTNNDGARLIFKYELKGKGKSQFAKIYDAVQKKEGAEIAGGGKKPECIVTGGLGTMAVTFGGQTYYVCCTGCRDAFNESPEKFVKAFKEKKK